MRLILTNAAKKRWKDEVSKLDWPLGLAVMRSPETSLKVRFSPATRALAGPEKVEKQSYEDWGQHTRCRLRSHL